jgi:hypothetical protein
MLRKKILIIFIFLFGFIFVVIGFAEKETKTQPETEIEKTLPPWQRVVLSNFECEKGGFGNVLFANFTIKNSNDVDVKDIVIECSCYAKSSTLLGSNRKTIFDIFPAKATRTIYRFNMGFIHPQTDKVGCNIISIIPIN